MATTLTHVTDSNNSNGGSGIGPFTTPSWSPSNGTPYLVSVVARYAGGQPPIPTLTGNGQTWGAPIINFVALEIEAGGGNLGDRRCNLWLIVPSGASAGGITVEWGSYFDGQITDVQVSQESISGPYGIVQWAVNWTYNNTFSGTWTTTLTHALRSGSIVYAIGFINTTSGLSVGSSMTQLLNSSDGFDLLTEVETGTTTAANLAVNTSGGAQNFGVLAVEIGSNPVVTVSPATQLVLPGATATFTVTATSSGGTLSYQWKKNGSNVGSNSASYTTPALAASDDLSDVYCTVTDSNGSTDSDHAYARVIPEPAAWPFQA